MNFKRDITVAFTGHRTYRGEANESLGEVIERLYARGFRSFLSGMAVGFDLAAAEAVLRCREHLPDLALVAVVPFAEQEHRFSPADKARFQHIVAEADEVITLAEEYHRGCYAQRNNFLVDNASLVVAWYGQQQGGTRYTVRRALRRGCEVWNLHPSASVRITSLF